LLEGPSNIFGIATVTAAYKVIKKHLLLLDREDSETVK
jgi:hypothetical protein